MHLLIIILLGGGTLLYSTTNLDPSTRWDIPIENETPAYIGGVPVADWSPNDSGTRVFEGLIKQEDDPYHDWDTDSFGPKVLSLDIIDSLSGKYLTTYILQTQQNELFRFFTDVTRNHEAWTHSGPKPVKILDSGTTDVGFHGVSFNLLKVKDVVYSDMGQWYEGILSVSTFQFGINKFYKYERDFNCTGYSNLVLRMNDKGESKDLLLASHEGWVYIVPYCGTAQPIAHHSTNSTIKICGLLMPLNTTKGMKEALMIFEVQRN